MTSILSEEDLNALQQRESLYLIRDILDEIDAEPKLLILCVRLWRTTIAI